MGFSDRDEKQRQREELIPRFAPVLSRMREVWGQPDARASWEEADFLALDPDGRLLVIEVKQGKDRRLPWAAAQVAYCAALVRRWANEVGETIAVQTIEHMLEQRRQLRLIPEGPSVKAPLEVVSVVAVGSPAATTMLGHLHDLAEALEADPELGCGTIAIWNIDTDARTIMIDEVS